MIRETLKRAGALLADFVASDRLDLLARQLAEALDDCERWREGSETARAEVRRLDEALDATRAELVGLQKEHERQRAELLSAHKALSEAERSASERDHDWAWAQRQLREGKVVTHPILDPGQGLVGSVPRLWRVGTDRDHCFKLETQHLYSIVSHPRYPGTVGWRVVSASAALTYEASDAPIDG